jgi:hypothetical protein
VFADAEVGESMTKADREDLATPGVEPSPPPSAASDTITCNCGHEYPEFLGRFGCPNCEGSRPQKGKQCSHG